MHTADSQPSQIQPSHPPSILLSFVVYTSKSTASLLVLSNGTFICLCGASSGILGLNLLSSVVGRCIPCFSAIPSSFATVNARKRVQPQSKALTCGIIQLVATTTRCSMDISHQSPQAHRLPQIYIQSSNASNRMMIPSRSGTSTARSSVGGLSSSIPMSIPNARDDDHGAPPPLPPPRFISDIKSEAEYGGGSGNTWPARSPKDQHSWGKESSVRSGSSLYGSFSGDANGLTDGLDMRRGSTSSTIKSISEVNGHQNSYSRADEGYASLSTTGSMSSS